MYFIRMYWRIVASGATESYITVESDQSWFPGAAKFGNLCQINLNVVEDTVKE